jgi:hypothetical protein
MTPDNPAHPAITLDDRAIEEAVAACRRALIDLRSAQKIAAVELPHASQRACGTAPCLRMHVGGWFTAR